jgi:membrane AbrB-like protein
VIRPRVATLTGRSDSLPPPTRPAAKRSAGARTGRLALTLAVAALGGFVMNSAGVPLAWMLGPLFVTAIAAMSGLDPVPVKWSRELGQVVVGIAIGLRFTAPVLAATAALLPAMVLATLYVIAVTTTAAFMIRPLGRVDRKTAFFATAAAGMADMAIVARERGGDAEAVSVVHAIRVASIVTAVPLLVFALGGEGGAAAASTSPPAGAWWQLAILLALGVVAALAFKPLHFPNPWLVGPIFLAAGFAAADMLVVSIPRLLLIAAQLMIGIALGARFKRELLGRLPRVVAAALAISLFLIVAAALGAEVLSLAIGLPFATAFLALAPAGATEMVLTAAIMHLDTASVTAFHVMRIAVIASTILLTFGLFERISERFDGTRI